MLRSSRFFLALLVCLVSSVLGTVTPPALTRAQTLATVTIAGSVVDARLNPLAGVAVTLESRGSSVKTTRSDSAGVFTFSGVVPGDYRVRAELNGYPAFARDIHVPARTARVRLPIVMSTPSEAIAVLRTGDRESDPAAGLSAPGAASPNAAAVPAPPPAPPAAHGAVVDARAQSANVDPIGPRITPTPATAMPGVVAGRGGWIVPPGSTERYEHIDSNVFRATRDEPLSTFSADVDTASYANVRRFLSNGQLPPADAVRVEEMVNYFRFDYAEPAGSHPLTITTEVDDCPWAPSHKLVLIGARAADRVHRERAGRNLVLLVDVSGSMAPPDRLPLLKTALAQFVDTLQPDDRIALVTYAGYSGVALASTPARERSKIHDAIERLGAGGSTNGASGILLAYRIAREAYVPGGVNRVILATDGDFNVGITRQDDLIHLIERERESGVFLSAFGVGAGNLNDAMMEQLADRGNGNYSYLDSLREARRVLVHEGASTLETVAKDVKFQVEFNPAAVASWKLIGYENRRLEARDFNDDRKDAGDVGAGHTVTVLYEVVPAGSGDDAPGRLPGSVDPLKYQPTRQVVEAPGAARHEWLTVKVRYKAPDGDTSELITQPVTTSSRPARHLPLAAAIAEFGLRLRTDARNAAGLDALVRRLHTLDVPRELAAEKDELEDLAAVAATLARR